MFEKPRYFVQAETPFGNWKTKSEWKSLAWALASAQAHGEVHKSVRIIDQSGNTLETRQYGEVVK